MQREEQEQQLESKKRTKSEQRGSTRSRELTRLISSYNDGTVTPSSGSVSTRLQTKRRGWKMFFWGLFVAGNHPDVTRNSSRKRVFINEPKLFENRQCRHADIIISRRYLFITLVFLRNKHFINFIIVIKTLPSSFI